MVSPPFSKKGVFGGSTPLDRSMSTGYIETWHKFRCPKCKAANWTAEDNDDMTRPDIEGIKCYKCKHEWCIVEDTVWLEMIEQQGGANYEDGTASPA